MAAVSCSNQLNCYDYFTNYTTSILRHAERNAALRQGEMCVQLASFIVLTRTFRHVGHHHHQSHHGLLINMRLASNKRTVWPVVWLANLILLNHDGPNETTLLSPSDSVTSYQAF